MSIQKPISSILIANRGEIASRIIRTCRKMGIKSIAVFSDADRSASYVMQADSAIHIGENSMLESYLSQDKILDAARKSVADAIHPGYGFLSENATFARRCAIENFIFIGPHPEAIEAMGSKSAARTLMQQHGVPVIPGVHGCDQSNVELKKAAMNLGMPVLLKAAAGGGGKGMRIVKDEKDFDNAVDSVKREAINAFGNDELIIEKYISSGRHIEFQVFGDQHGNVIHLLERECTIQRRYQKILEESPSPVISDDLRKSMGAAAVKAAKAIRYDNAGTVEFLFDEQSGEFYFLEVNTRLQVEHPVTEAITGLDLVQMQIETAMRLPLCVKQEDVKGCGYALEARLYAEDPSNNFMPSTGTVYTFNYPEVDGLRIDSAVIPGSEVSVYYDPMIAKIIVHDKDRTGAHLKMSHVLRNMVCAGITTNQDFLLKIVEHVNFRDGNYDTHFIENHFDLPKILQKSGEQISLAAIACTLYDWHNRESQRSLLRSLPSGWRNSFYDFQKVIYESGRQKTEVKYRYRDGAFIFIVDGAEHFISAQRVEGSRLQVEVDGVVHKFTITGNGQTFHAQNESTGNITLNQIQRLPTGHIDKAAGGYISPMPSQVVKIMVTEGQHVVPGDALVILSSMKMENTISSEQEGKVETIYATEGSNVEKGFVLLSIKDKS